MTAASTAAPQTPKTLMSDIDPTNIDMQALADIAGVSRSTVSRALADSSLVNDKTKQRIQQLAADHNYIPNEAARNLRLKQSRMICVVLMLEPDSGQRTSDPFFMEMLGSIADHLGDAGYDMLLSHTAIHNAAEFQSSRRYRQAEGILVIGQGQGHRDLNELARSGRPMVVWGANIQDAEYCVVGSDNVQGGFRATQHLIDQGCQHLAFFGDTQLPEPSQRFEGFLSALNANGIAFHQENALQVPFDHPTAEKIIRTFLDTGPTIDAVVCCSDLIAMTAIAQIDRHGLPVPERISVTGYDNIGIASRVSPPLTTVDQHIRDGGRLMVEQLMAQLRGEKVVSQLLETSLVERAST